MPCHRRAYRRRSDEGHPALTSPLAGGWKSPDGEGTYLAACVFYTTVFGQSPVGLSYHGDLSDTEAAAVQQVASDTVLSDWVQFGLPSSGGA